MSRSLTPTRASARKVASKMAKVFCVSSGRVKTVPVPEQKDFTGRVIVFEYEGEKVAGVCKCMTAAGPVVELAMPDENGVLHNTSTEVILKAGMSYEFDDSLKVTDVGQVKAWQASLALMLGEDNTKAMKIIRENPADDKSPIVDYQDVVIEGYASTFVGTTPADRDGDYVMPKAFDKTLAKFRENPVMLLDHQNSVAALAGSFEKIGTNERGLAVRGRVSNAPGLRDTRFKIVEGHLKSFSMGGLFYYNDDGRGIEEVELFEASLTPVPANADALFQVRSVSINECAKACKKHLRW